MSFGGKFADDLPTVGGGAGFKTPFGIQLPPGGRLAAYVRSTPSDLDDAFIAASRLPTLAAGLAQCRPGMGDIVYVLTGHSENVVDGTMLNNLVPGTRVIGQLGDPGLMPVFRWTAAAANWALNDANCSFAGLRLRMEGFNGITNCFTVTAASNSITGCDIEVASGAALKATIMGTVSTGADQFAMVANRIRGTETHNLTNGLLVSAAVRDLTIERNRMMFSVTAANGLINFTAAALGVYVGNNTMYNSHTASSSVLTCGAFAADGMIENNRVKVLSTAAFTNLTTGFFINAASLFTFYNNLGTNDPRTSGFNFPTVDS